MARTPRFDEPGAWHHVMNRGARWQATFLNDSDRRLFLGLLGKAHQRFGVELHAYALMDNHFHFVVNTPVGGLSKSMQYLGSVYSRVFNERHGFDGPLFRGRFHSLLIKDDAQLLTTVRYVHRNPFDIQSGPLADYRWSSHPAYLGRSHTPSWLRTDLVMELLGNSATEYAQLIEGPDAVVEKSPRQLAKPSKQSTPPSDSVQRVRSALDALGVEDERLARSVVVLVTIDHLGGSPTEATRALGYSSRNGTWSALRRARLRAECDPVLADLVQATAEHPFVSGLAANTNAA